VLLFHIFAVHFDHGVLFFLFVVNHFPSFVRFVAFLSFRTFRGLLAFPWLFLLNSYFLFYLCSLLNIIFILAFPDKEPRHHFLHVIDIEHIFTRILGHIVLTVLLEIVEHLLEVLVLVLKVVIVAIIGSIILLHKRHHHQWVHEHHVHHHQLILI